MSRSSTSATSAAAVSGTVSPEPRWCTCARAVAQAGQRASTTGDAQFAQIRCSQLIAVPFARGGGANGVLVSVARLALVSPLDCPVPNRAGAREGQVAAVGWFPGPVSPHFAEHV